MESSAVLNKVKIFTKMVRIEHTVFALPFAYVGALLVDEAVPSVPDLFWITVAMFGARTAAMSLNRILDRHLDAKNPRTAERALPRGLMTVKEVWLSSLLSFALLFIAAWQLSPLAVKMFPLVVVVLSGYSYTKRFTWACHLWLGAALGLAPLAAWIAISNCFDLAPLFLFAGVMFWVAGFDIIYACLDYDFDRRTGVYSIPACFGIKSALHVAGAFHLVAPVMFIITGMLLDLSPVYFTGVGIAMAILMYEHRIVRPDDLGRVNVAFFHMNAFLSICLFLCTLIEVLC